MAEPIIRIKLNAMEVISFTPLQLLTLLDFHAHTDCGTSRMKKGTIIATEVEIGERIFCHTEKFEGYPEEWLDDE